MTTARDFLGEEEYKRMKMHYDELMHFRKTVKGKPTLEERLQLTINNDKLEFYQTVLFHNALGNCDCRKCQYVKQGIDIYSPYQLDLFRPNLNIKIPLVDKFKKIFEEYKV